MKVEQGKIVGGPVGSGGKCRRVEPQQEKKIPSEIMKPGFFQSKVGIVAVLSTMAATFYSATTSDSYDTPKMMDTIRIQGNITRNMIEDGDYKYSKISAMEPLSDHPFPDEETTNKMAERFGHWHFWDGDEDKRPTNDYMAKYPNRDIPGDKFPEDAWQADAVFVNHFLNDADQLISRAMEAIFTEYGHGKPLPAEGLAKRMKMFHWEKVNLATATEPPKKYSKRGDRGNGGWTTQRSFDGLVRRLLHAMMTSDTFTVVLAGHSAAAGKGNSFRESYTMQFHKIMYPIFARLGVKLITRNAAQGGLGTVHNGMGSGNIYGDEVDLLLWDDGMLEGDHSDHIDLFLRQGLLAGKRVPVVWGGTFDLLRMLHENADVDVGEWGNAKDGIPEVESFEQAEEVPWAARYMKCSDLAAPLCKEEPKFRSTCWIDREDGILPDVKQRETPKGQVWWHPGWRDHQLIGRNLAMAVLTALQAAVNTWNEGVMGGPPLDDDFWHVTSYYENIREKVKNLDHSLGECYKIEGKLPTRMCNIKMNARTQFTPRANPEATSLTSIIKPTADGYIPKNDKQALYEGPDAHNPLFDVPEGELDVYNVIVGRRRLQEELATGSFDIGAPVKPINQPTSAHTDRGLGSGIEPGRGWEIFGEPQGNCDGTYNAICGRSGDNDCILIGHHDERGAIIGNEYSGWLVLTLENLKEGIIVIKLVTQVDGESLKTKGWTSINNEPDHRMLRDGKQRTLIDMENTHRVKELDKRVLRIVDETPTLPETFVFEYAIDGQVTSLDRAQFLQDRKQLQREVETITLLDNPDFTTSAKTVEVAIRLRGCGKECLFGLSHIYWA